MGDRVLGIDGAALKAPYRPDSCAAANICAVSEAELECSFLALLPQGPLWDAARAGAGGECAGMGGAARFIGKRLYAVISEVLWPAYREMSPYTAYDSLDDWLLRLNWQDCWTDACARRQNDTLSPAEVMIRGCPVYCPPRYSAEMELALKAALVRALWRLRLAPAPTLGSVNFILSSLGAKAEPDLTGYDPQNPCKGKLCLRIRATGAALPVPVKDCGEIQRFCPPLFDGELDCGGEGAQRRRFYPGVMLGACLARNMIFSRRLCLIPEFYPPEDALAACLAEQEKLQREAESCAARKRDLETALKNCEAERA